MNCQVVTKTVSAQPLAAVRRRAPGRDVGQIWKPALDLVWEFLRRHEGLRADGHNCFLYHHPAHRDAAMNIDFGVQVIRHLSRHVYSDNGHPLFIVQVTRAGAGAH